MCYSRWETAKEVICKFNDTRKVQMENVKKNRGEMEGKKHKHYGRPDTDDQCMYCRVPEELGVRMCRINVWRHTGWKLSKISERIQVIISINTINMKQDEYKEDNILWYHNKIL